MAAFNAISINGYTRKFAYQQRLPKVKRVGTEELKFTKSQVNDANVFELRHVPPEGDLLIWRCRLQNMATIAVERAVVVCEQGTFTLDSVENAIHDRTKLCCARNNLA